MLGAKAEEIVFTSGGTEADNMAIFGAGGHVITTTVEHPAVLQAAAQLPDATFVPVDGRRRWSTRRRVRAAIRPDTKLISVMHVNNELGVIQPMREIARDRSRSWSPVPLRRRAGGGQDPGERRRTWRGFVFDQRSQDLRAQGHGRALRSQGH